MTTVYIKGKEGFKEAILNKLNYSWLNGNSEIEQKLIMFWLRDHSQLHNFKSAIGSRLIFKYRLQFFTNLEEHLQAEDNKVLSGFSSSEKKMIFDMTSVENEQQKQRTSRRSLNSEK